MLEMFGTILTGAVTGALPYILGGVAAGAVLLAVLLGVRKALAFSRYLATGELTAAEEERARRAGIDPY